MKILATYVTLLLLMALPGCTTHQENSIQAVPNVDLERFMGDWYVIAGILTFPERNAVNPLENYQLNDNDTIDTTFTFNNKTSDGPKKTLNMTGFAKDKPDNGIWGMRWIWPIKADYRIAYLDEDYQTTIVARNKRDYVWIMSRTSKVDESKLEELINFAVELGYDRSKIKLTNWQQPSQTPRQKEKQG